MKHSTTGTPNSGSTKGPQAAFDLIREQLLPECPHCETAGGYKRHPQTKKYDRHGYAVPRIPYPDEFLEDPLTGYKHLLHKMLDRIYGTRRTSKTKHQHGQDWLDKAAEIGLVSTEERVHPTEGKHFRVEPGSPADQLWPKVRQLLNTGETYVSGRKPYAPPTNIRCWACDDWYRTPNKDLASLLRPLHMCANCARRLVVGPATDWTQNLPDFADDGEPAFEWWQGV